MLKCLLKNWKNTLRCITGKLGFFSWNYSIFVSMKLKRFFILFLMLFLTFGMLAQNRKAIDSLKTAASEAQSDFAKFHLLNNLANEYNQFSEDTAILYLKQALDIVRDLDSPKFKASALCELGKHYAFKSNFTEAIEYLDLAENILVVFPNDSIQSAIHSYKALLYTKASQFEKADEQAGKSLEIARRINDLNRVSAVYTIYHEIYNRIGEPEKAQEYAYKYYQLKIKLKDASGIAAALHNLAHHYSLLGMHDSTLFYLKNSIALNKKFNNKNYLGSNYLNLGMLFHDLHQYDSADVYYNLAMENHQQIGYRMALSSIKINMAYNFLSMGDTTQALMQFRSLVESLDEPVSLENKVDSYKLLASIAFAQKRFQEAYIYYEKFKELNDELKEVTNTSLAKLLEMQMKYDNQKNQIEINRQRVEIDLQQKRVYIIILVSVILVLCIIIWFVIKLMRAKAHTVEIKRQKLEEELEFKNREMTSNLMALMMKNEILEDISKDLLELGKLAVKNETKSMINKIAFRIRKSRDVELWKEFDIRFNQVHNQFHDSLNRKFPSLTPAEKRLCAFLKMNMSTKDISEITGTAPRSVDTVRYKIRKKLRLTSEDNLVDFLSQI
jgi:tetratricopeptide (TPR) repeat protein/DNA-binding CsgD family transcriptional regulator